LGSIAVDIAIATNRRHRRVSRTNHAGATHNSAIPKWPATSTIDPSPAVDARHAPTRRPVAGDYVHVRSTANRHKSDARARARITLEHPVADDFRIGRRRPSDLRDPVVQSTAVSLYGSSA